MTQLIVDAKTSTGRSLRPILNSSPVNKSKGIEIEANEEAAVGMEAVVGAGAEAGAEAGVVALRRSTTFG
jgi:hypothetical protein